MERFQAVWRRWPCGPLLVLGMLVLAGWLLLGSLAPAEAQSTAPPTWKSADRDQLPQTPELAAAIRLGQQIYNDPRTYAAPYVGAALACWSCHVGEGYHPGLIPLSGVAGVYPAYSARDGRIISLADRIRSCFVRSLNGSAPPDDSDVLLAMSAFLHWQSEGQPRGVDPATHWREALPPADWLAIDQLDPRRGSMLYAERCASCHGADGQGGNNIPPVWGPRSYNDGAGLARVYTAAALIYQAMPATAPGSLSRDDAQHLAAFIDAQERPVYRDWASDYPNGDIPVDAVYNQRRYPTNPLRERLNAR